MKNYLDLISRYYPNTSCHSMGDPDNYDAIIWEETPISLVDLEAKVVPYAQEEMWKLIQAERDRRKSNGVKVGENWFHSDASSRIQQLGLVMFGANMPAGIMWKTMDDTFVPMTPTLAAQIFQAAAVSDMTIFSVAEQKKLAMIALADPNTHNPLTGWPATHGEV